MTALGRRTFMRLGAAGVAGLVTGCGRRRALEAEEFALSGQVTPLRAHASARGVMYGAAVRGVAFKDSAFTQLLADQCEILVSEGAMKWDTMRPALETFEFGGGDWLVEFAQKHGQKVRGHCLVWHDGLPAWFKSHATAFNARQLMTDHIRTVVSHYAGKIHSWDVVNEIIEPGHKRDDGLNNSPWLRLVGTEFIELAFHTAAEADPAAMLVWNENLLEEETGYSRAKRHATLRLLKELKSRGTPVHALGLEAHLHGETPIAQELGDFLAKVADLGMKVMVTELDVRDGALPGEVGKRDQLIAQKYKELLDVVLAQKALIAVLTWGLSDRYSWLTDPRTQTRFRRTDELPSRPLPFDVDLNRKPAFAAMQRAFDAAPTR